MSFERRFSNRREVKSIPPLFVGLHINPEVLEREWEHGKLKFDETERSKKTRKHLGICHHCRDEVLAEIRAGDRDWKSDQVPVGDRD